MERYYHKKCIKPLYKDLDDMRTMRDKKYAIERMTSKILPKYRWMMTYPPKRLASIC